MNMICIQIRRESENENEKKSWHSDHHSDRIEKIRSEPSLNGIIDVDDDD